MKSLDNGALCLELLHDFCQDQDAYHAALTIFAGLFWADGTLSPEESKILDTMLAGLGGGGEGLIQSARELWRHPKQLSELAEKIPNPRWRLKMVDFLIFAAYCDGAIARVERDYVHNYLQTIGIESRELREQIVRNRERWYEHLNAGVQIQLRLEEDHREILSKMNAVPRAMEF